MNYLKPVTRAIAVSALQITILLTIGSYGAVACPVIEVNTDTGVAIAQPDLEKALKGLIALTSLADASE